MSVQFAEQIVKRCKSDKYEQFVLFIITLDFFGK